MAFTGKVYWVSGADVIVCWDSATNDLTWVFARQADILGGAFASDYGYFGTLTVLGDGRIMSRLGDDAPDWAIVFDADLSPASAEYWSATTHGSSAVSFDGAIGIHDTTRNVNWLYRSSDGDRFNDAYWWLAYDDTGAVVDQRALYDNAWAFTWPGGPSAFGNAVLLDDTLYRSIDAFNALDRFNLTTGAWERTAGFTSTSGANPGISPIGDYLGEVVWAAYDSGPFTVELVTLDDSGSWIDFSDSGFPTIPLGDAPITRTWSAPGFDPSQGTGKARTSGTDAIWISIEDVDDVEHLKITDLDLAGDTTSVLFEFTEIFLLIDGTPTTIDGDWWTSINGNGFAMVLVPGADTPRVSPLLRYPRTDGRGMGPSRHVPGAALRHVGNF